MATITLTDVPDDPKVTATVLSKEWVELRLEADNGNIVALRVSSLDQGAALAVAIHNAVQRARRAERDAGQPQLGGVA